ncbi:MAG: hypothetical protein LBL04_05425 [Bacteroidales bacterium]|jgi:hypothetical protein|nr:hypothetical protein [Bacteroidales bacterium]
MIHYTNSFRNAWMALLCGAMLCVSCKKDEPESAYEIVVSIENGTSYNDQIDLVKAEIELDDENDIITLVSAPYTGGGFTITLPVSVSDRYLVSIDDEISTDVTVTVSDPQVKVCMVSLEAYKSEINTGYFYHGVGKWVGEVMYVDRNVTITGSYTETETYGETTLTYTYKYDMHLSRGWNMVYDRMTEEGRSFEYEMTTQVPAEAKWVFYDYPLGFTPTGFFAAGKAADKIMGHRGR